MMTQQNIASRLGWLAFFYTFAVFNWCLYLGLALRSGTFFKEDTEKEQLRFAICWSSVRPIET